MKCQANEYPHLVTHLAAQSTDQGKTVTWMPICRYHASWWNDGSDWAAPVYQIIMRKKPLLLAHTLSEML